MNKHLALIITTHPAYFRYLENLVHVITEREARCPVLNEVVLVVDGGQAPPLDRCSLPPNWKVVEVNCFNPQGSRNAGLAALDASSTWVCYLDGDNVPTENYFALMAEASAAANLRVAMLYGDIKQVDGEGNVVRVFNMPEWSVQAAQQDSIIDTCSCWRVDALRGNGGWEPTPSVLEDYITVLQLMRQGWQGQKVPKAVSEHRRHGQNRSITNGRFHAEALWQDRRHLLITLFAGREHCYERLMRWYLDAELPPLTEVVWVDNSRSRAFNQRLWRSLDALVRRRPEIKNVSIIRNPAELPSRKHFDIHNHVGRMYNAVLHDTQAEIVVTVEDDTIPPVSGLRSIVAPLQPWGKVAAVSGLYACRDNPKVCVASHERFHWARMPIWESLPHTEYMTVGMVGGGFTAWNTPILKHVLPMRGLVEPNVLGWDGMVCASLNRLGYHFQLAVRCRCDHLVMPERRF